jgi:hypothetical protein
VIQAPTSSAPRKRRIASKLQDATVIGTGRPKYGPRAKGRRQAGKIVLSNQVTFDDLKNLIVNDYRNNGRKSLPHLEQVRLPKFADVFEGMKTIDITNATVERYKSLRLKDGAAPATLNRELAALKRMYRLGLRHGLVAMVGHKTESIYRRYSIVDQAMLEVGASKLDQFQQAQGLSKPVVVSIKRRSRDVK